MSTSTGMGRLENLAQGQPARLFSLSLALGLSGLVLGYPKLLAPAGLDGPRHAWLALMMLGMSAGSVHGVGFIPQTRFWRLLLGPWVGWPLMLGGLAWLLAN